jgi:hypothetical protein
MNTLYIQDSTIGKYVTFNTVAELVKYIGDQIVPRAFKLTRSQYMQNLIDLGHGYDDPTGVTLTRAVADQFNIGIVKNGNYVRTDIHTADAFKSEEFGSETVNRFEDRGKF